MNSRADSLSAANLSQLSTADEELLADLLDQIMVTVEQGGTPDIEDLVKRHPQLATEIRLCIDDLNLLHQMAGPLSPKISQQQDLTALTDYKIGEELGRGAMGVVYAANEVQTGNPIALKILGAGSSANHQFVERFAREARVAGSLTHPHAVPVLSAGSVAGIHYYTMPLIEGDSLEKLIGHARIARRTNQHQDTLFASLDRYEEIAGKFADVADALHEAHVDGIVHRDVKPSNLLLDQAEKLWVTDFGLARAVEDWGLTETGDLIGTYRYMSPEQARGENDLVGAQSDIYSLGATLYEALTLRPVFRGNDLAKMLRKIEFTPAKPPRHWNASIPASLDTIILNAIHPSVQRRYRSARDFADDLRRFAKGETIRARRPRITPRWLKDIREHGGKIAIAACVTIVATAYIPGIVNRMRMDNAKTVTTQNQTASMGQLEQYLQTLRRQPPSRELNLKYREALSSYQYDIEDKNRIELLCLAYSEYAFSAIQSSDPELITSTFNDVSTFNAELVKLEAPEPCKLLTSTDIAILRTSATDDLQASSDSATLPDTLPIKLTLQKTQPSQITKQLALQWKRLSNLLATSQQYPRADLVGKLSVSLAKSIADTESSASNLLCFADSQANLAVIKMKSGDFDTAIPLLRDAINTLRNLDSPEAPNREVRRELAACHDYLGQALTATAHYRQAKESLDSALELALARHNWAPKDVNALHRLAAIWNNIGDLNRKMNKPTEAAKAFRNALRKQELAIQLSPNSGKAIAERSRIKANIISVHGSSVAAGG